ncbi:MAG: hypothetical protein WBP29_05385 [Candidatus Zixiibacteriota bacterium]
MNKTESAASLEELVERVTLLVDEIKLINLNLTIANARLRLTDNAFHAVGGSFRQLIDTTTETQEAAELMVKRARGEELTGNERDTIKRELDSSIEKIQRAAENIIQTVVAIKKGQRVNRDI